MPAAKAVIVQLRAEVGQYVAGMRQAAGATNAMANQMQGAAAKASRGSTAAMSAMSKVGQASLLVLAAGFAFSARAAIEFESTFAGVRKTVDASEKQFKALEKNLRGLAKVIPVNVNELNRIAELGGQLGVSLDGLTTFTETIAALGVTTNLSTENAALGLARLANILNVTEQDFDRIGATIVGLGNNFATTEDQILTFALRIAPVGNTVGLTADQVLALATAFSSVGIPAERGGTAVQKVFTAMERSVQTGTASLKTFADTAGLTVTEFRELYGRDAAAALNAFITGLGDMAEQGENVFDVLDDVKLGSERTVQSILAIANAEGLLGRALEQGANDWRENIALNEEARKRYETTEGRIKLAGAAFRDAAITIGSELTPAIRTLADVITDLVNTGFVSWVTDIMGILGTLQQNTFSLAQGFVGGVAMLVPATEDWGRATASAALNGAKLNNVILLLRQGVIQGETAVDKFAVALRVMGTQIDAGTIQKLSGELMLTREEMLGVLNDMSKSTSETKGNRDAWKALYSQLTLTDAYMQRAEGFRIQAEMAAWARGEVTELTDAMTGLQEAMDLVYENERNARDGAIGLIDATNELALATKEFNKESTPDNALAMVEAYEAWIRAGQNVSEEGIIPLTRSLTEMRFAGILTQEQVLDLSAEFLRYQSAALAARDGSQGILVSFQNIEQAAEELGVPIGLLIQRMYGLNAAMAATAANAHNFALIMQKLSDPSRSIAGVDPDFVERRYGAKTLAPIVNAISARTAKLFEDLGEGWTDDIARGLSKGGGGVEKTLAQIARDGARAYLAALRTALSYQDAQKALEGARRAIQDINAELSQTMLDIQRTMVELARAQAEAMQVTLEEEVGILSAELAIFQAQRDLLLMQRELANIPKELAAAENELAEAQERYNAALIEAERLTRTHDENLTDLQASLLATIRAYGLGNASFADLVAAEVALAEELAKSGDAADIVEEAQEDLIDAQEDYANTVEELAYREKELQMQILIAQKEAILAQQELIQLKKDSIGPTKEVLDLEEKLKELREKQTELTEDLTDAERDLLNAELDLIEAELDLMEAQEEMLGMKPQIIAFFDAIANKVLGMASAFATARASLDSLIGAAGGTPTGGTGGGGGGGGGGTATGGGGGGGTTAPAPTYTGPNYVTPSGTIAPAPLYDPEKRYGGITIAHGGAFFPGPESREFLTLVRGGEMVFDTAQLASAIQTAFGRSGGNGGGTVIIQLDGKEIGRYMVDDFTRNVANSMKVARRVEGVA